MKSLRTTNLTIARGQKTLCQHLNITITSGDFWAVLGPNGAGKTTLLQTLANQLTPTAGSISLNEAPLTALSARQIAQEIGILFQDFQPTFPQTVYEYCLSARFPHHGIFTTKYQSADLSLTEKILNALQLTTYAQQNIQQLSGGEQRRIAIASLLIQAPNFFLLDEPTNHLDLHHQIHTLNLFANLTQNHNAVIMSSHDINLAQRYCNKILMMFPDGNTAHGTRDEMLNSENLTRLYQHPIDAVQDGKQTYWQPRSTT